MCLFSKPIQCDDSTTDCKNLREAADYLEMVCIAQFLNEQALVQQLPIEELINIYKKDSQNLNKQKAEEFNSINKPESSTQSKQEIDAIGDPFL
jgi:hypothetical protein